MALPGINVAAGVYRSRPLPEIQLGRVIDPSVKRPAVVRSTYAFARLPVLTGALSPVGYTHLILDPTPTGWFYISPG